MPRLLILRHAKAAPAAPGEADVDRPLDEQGRRAAERMGAHMAAEGFVPGRVLVSAARRTRETWERVAPHLPVIADIRVDERLYHAPAQRLLDLLHEEVGAADLLFVGHNPGIHLFALMLARPASQEAYRQLTEKFPTAALCVLDFEAPDWAGTAPKSARVERFVTPRLLGVAAGDD